MAVLADDDVVVHDDDAEWGSAMSTMPGAIRARHPKPPVV
jgi:hypothetical protein